MANESAGKLPFTCPIQPIVYELGNIFTLIPKVLMKPGATINMMNLQTDDCKSFTIFENSELKL